MLCPSSSSRLARIDYIWFKWNPEEEPRLLEDYGVAVKKLDESEECMGYELSRSSRPGQLLMRIEWGAGAAEWPLDPQPAPLRRFLLALRTALKTVAEVDSYRPVTLPVPDRKPASSFHAERKTA